MKFGCCTTVTNAATLQEIGYDFIELGVSRDLTPLEPESPVPGIVDSLSKAGIPVETYNLLVPPFLKITGPDRDLDQLSGYMASACSRAAETSAKVLVFGSGGARRVPEGYDHEAASEEIVCFLQSSADLASQFGLQIAIEPLQRAECNIINTVAEAVEISRRVGEMRTVTVLSDLYHVTSDQQPISETADAGPCLTHVHVACGSDRHSPSQQDLKLLIEYFRSLRKARYDSCVSIEASWKDFKAEAARSLTVLKEAWEASRI